MTVAIGILIEVKPGFDMTVDLSLASWCRFGVVDVTGECVGVGGNTARGS
jgi:hypothetical protein